MNYTIDDFTELMRKFYNMTDVRFKELYDHAGMCYPAYVAEKYDDFQCNPLRWWCNLDSATQEKFAKYLLGK